MLPLPDAVPRVGAFLLKPRPFSTRRGVWACSAHLPTVITLKSQTEVHQIKSAMQCECMPFGANLTYKCWRLHRLLVQVARHAHANGEWRRQQLRCTHICVAPPMRSWANLFHACRLLNMTMYKLNSPVMRSLLQPLMPRIWLKTGRPNYSC